MENTIGSAFMEIPLRPCLIFSRLPALSDRIRLLGQGAGGPVMRIAEGYEAVICAPFIASFAMSGQINPTPHSFSIWLVAPIPMAFPKPQLRDRGRHSRAPGNQISTAKSSDRKCVKNCFYCVNLQPVSSLLVPLHACKTPSNIPSYPGILGPLVRATRK